MLYSMKKDQWQHLEQPVPFSAGHFRDMQKCKVYNLWFIIIQHSREMQENRNDAWNEKRERMTEQMIKHQRNCVAIRPWIWCHFRCYNYTPWYSILDLQWSCRISRCTWLSCPSLSILADDCASLQGMHVVPHTHLTFTPQHLSSFVFRPSGVNSFKCLSNGGEWSHSSDIVLRGRTTRSTGIVAQSPAGRSIAPRRRLIEAMYIQLEIQQLQLRTGIGHR